MTIMTTYYEKIHSPTTTHSISLKQIPIYLLVVLLNSYDIQCQIYMIASLDLANLLFCFRIDFYNINKRFLLSLLKIL